MAINIIRIKLRSYDYRILDKSTKSIVQVSNMTRAKIRGPVPLPTKISRFAVIRSPHVNKNSMEHFELRIHKRLIDIVNPSPETMKELSQLALPAGVDVEIKGF